METTTSPYLGFGSAKRDAFILLFRGSLLEMQGREGTRDLFGTGRLGRWARRRRESRAARQRGDVHALDVEGDPRGGVQSEAYRQAEPRDMVREQDVVMSGPGGAPQEGESVAELHQRNVRWRRRHWHPLQRLLRRQ
jgi:hypothetical protein